MKQFTFSDMNRASGEILEAALIEPVMLTKHGKARLVILSANAYERLSGQPRPQVYRLEDAPEAIHNELMTGLQFDAQLPDWLAGCLHVALLGEIYLDIRAVAIGYGNNGEVLIRYYLDREPTHLDHERVGIVATNLDALGGKRRPLNKIDIQCVHATGSLRDLEPLSGFIYARREDRR